MFTLTLATVLLGSVQSESLMSGLLARCDAIESAVIEYRVRIVQLPENRVAIERDCRAAIEGSNWSLIASGVSDHDLFHLVNVGGVGVQVRGSSPAAENVTTGDVVVGNPSPLISYGFEDQPPFRAGALWYPMQVEFIRSHQKDFVASGSEKLDGIDVVLLTLSLSEADHRAFMHLNKKIQGGGTLRLYVAPQLGHCLVRAQNVALDGTVMMTMDAREFAEVAPGLFFPTKWRRETLDDDARPCLYLDYEMKPKLVNEPIPAEFFDVAVPKGWMVQDERDKAHKRVFRLEADTPALALAKLSDSLRPQPPRNGNKTWAVTIALGLLVGTLTALGWWLVRRRREAYV